MKFHILLAIILSSPWVDTLVVSKLDMNSFINYYQKEIMQHDVEKIKELFNKKDLCEYCDQLRHARIYDAVNTNEELLQEPYKVVHVFSKETLQVERDNAQMQLFSFRLGNSKETRAFWGFQCMNYAKNMSWIVSPTFVPDSAFLFEFQLNFRLLSRRELQKGSEVIARSVAFIDEEGNCTLRNIKEILLKFSEMSNKRDPLCELNPVLQYRLCSLALNSFVDSFSPLDDLQADNLTSRKYTVEEYKQYFDLNVINDRCDLVNLNPHYVGPKKRSLYRQMLHCPVNQEKREQRKVKYHIGLNPFNQTQIFLRYEVVQPYRFKLTWQLQIPFLRHIDIHHYIHEEYS